MENQETEDREMEYEGLGILRERRLISMRRISENPGAKYKHFYQTKQLKYYLRN